MIAEDTALFAEQYPGVENVAGVLNFSLDNDSDNLRIFSHENETIVDITYMDQSPWPALTDGTGRTVEFDENFDNQDNPLHWFTGCLHGSPGEIYDPLCSGIFVEENEDGFDWNVYPVPADDQLIVRWNDLTSVATIRLFDVTGKMVIEKEIRTAENVFDISMMSAGAYSISIQQGDLVSSKMIVVK